MRNTAHFSIAAFLVLIVLSGQSLALIWEVTSEFTDTTFDQSALSSWEFENFKEELVSVCNNQQLVGGYQISGQAKMSKQFKLLEPPKKLYISFDLYFIDGWETTFGEGKNKEQIIVLINAQPVLNIASNYLLGLHSASSNLCGESTPDRQTRIGLTVPFTEMEFTLTVEGRFDNITTTTSSPWWGIRDLTILADECTSENTLALTELPGSDGSFGDTNWVTKTESASTDLTSQCGDTKLLGGIGKTGPNASFQRTIENLPEHTFVIINLTAYFLDSFDINDSIVFYLDDKIVHEQARNSLAHKETLCGQGKYLESIENIEIFVPHNSKTATIKIFLNIDQKSFDESFGFNNFAFSTSMPCPIIYDKPNHKGNQLQFCGELPNLNNKNWGNKSIKSIYLPKGLKLGYSKNVNGKEEIVEITETNKDLSKKELKYLNRAFHEKGFKEEKTKNSEDDRNSKDYSQEEDFEEPSQESNSESHDFEDDDILIKKKNPKTLKQK